MHSRVFISFFLLILVISTNFDIQSHFFGSECEHQHKEEHNKNECDLCFVNYLNYQEFNLYYHTDNHFEFYFIEYPEIESKTSFFESIAFNPSHISGQNFNRPPPQHI